MKNGIKLAALAGAVVVLAGAYAAVSKFTSHKEAEDSTAIIAAHFDEDINSLSWETEGTQFCAKKNANGIWHLDSDKDFPLDNDYIHSIVEQLRSIEALRVVNESAENEDEYGLKNPFLCVTVGCNGENTVLRFGDTNGQGNYFISGQNDAVYLVDSSVAEKFRSDIYELVDMQDVPDLYNLKKIEITAGSMVTTITSDENGKLYAVIDGTKKPLAATQSSEITQAVLAISPQKCVNYKGDYKEYGLDSPQYSIAITYMAQSEDEDDIESVFILNIGNEDDNSNLYISFENSPLIYTISKETLKSLLITDTNSLITEDR